MNNIVKEIQETLAGLSIPEKAIFFPKFFKTGKEEYGEGDLFSGVKVPDQRSVIFKNKFLSKFLSSKYPEHGLTTFFMLVLKFEKPKDQHVKDKIVTFYLNHLQYANNWHLVDSSCYKIVGRYAFENLKKNLLRVLSESEEMPRTSLRYAIEKLDEDLRQDLKGIV